MSETAAPKESLCGKIDSDGFMVFCDSEDGTYPSDIYGTGFFVGVFLGFIFVSGLIMGALIYCSRTQERRRQNQTTGKLKKKREELCWLGVNGASRI